MAMPPKIIAGLVQRRFEVMSLFGFGAGNFFAYMHILRNTLLHLRILCAPVRAAWRPVPNTTIRITFPVATQD